MALDEENIIVELRSVFQFNDSIDNFVMRAVVPSEKDSASRALKWTMIQHEQIEALQSVMKPTGVH